MLGNLKGIECERHVKGERWYSAEENFRKENEMVGVVDVYVGVFLIKSSGEEDSELFFVDNIR